MFDNVFYVEACEQITLGDVGSNIDLKIMGWFLVCIKVEALGIFVLLSLTIETWGNKESFLADVQAIVALILLPYNISIILRLNGLLKRRLTSRISLKKNLSSGLKIIR